ncbi:MAG: GGDEF domain-containing protein [Lachnospiraceae bacterium]|nr:GGDEF domain-containing protein [Lachnospiraceae bacterium]MBR4992754.1 GGDEF domain-containing protein [Lachnospiraceae bacterium]
MKNQNEHLLSLRRFKLIELVILCVIDVAFFIILFSNSTLREKVFSNPGIITLFVFTWVMIVVGIVFLVIDFIFLRRLDKENHNLAKLAYLDSLTGIPNRYSCDLVFDQYDTPESVAKISCVLLQIGNLNKVNDSLGRKSGDRLLRDFCHILEGIGDEYGFVGRNGGNEFLCIIDESDRDKLHDFLNKTEDSIKEYNLEHEDAPIEVHSASVYNPEAGFKDLNSIISKVYSDLYSRAQ